MDKILLCIFAVIAPSALLLMVAALGWWIPRSFQAHPWVKPFLTECWGHWKRAAPYPLLGCCAGAAPSLAVVPGIWPLLVAALFGLAVFLWVALLVITAIIRKPWRS